MKLVIHPPVEAERLAAIRRTAGEMLVVNARDEAEATAHLATADGFFGRMTPALLEGARQLRWVQSPTASLEHYLFPALVDHPCELTNMRGLYYDVIADHVMGYVLCFARNLHLYIRQQVAATWAPIGGGEATPTFTGGQAQVRATDRAHRHLGDQSMGVVGLGSIGAEIARRAMAFGMRVVAVDPKVTQGPEGIEAVWPLDRLDRLLAETDFVVIAAPHTPQTEGLFDREMFAHMRPDAIFINIGRGAIVKLDALTEALREGRIAGAALDVFEVEPLPPEHPLWAMENVIITPHIASASTRIAERHLSTLLENVGRFARGEPLINVVDKTSWF